MRYIYVIQCEAYVKVGIAKNVKSRLKQLQTSNPHRLTVFFLRKTTEERAVEAEIHGRLKEEGHWVHGEWFSCKPEVARDAVISCCKADCRRSLPIRTNEPTVVLTRNMIRGFLTNGVGLPAWKAKILGVKFPLKRNWISNLVGMEIPAIDAVALGKRDRSTISR